MPLLDVVALVPLALLAAAPWTPADRRRATVLLAAGLVAAAAVVVVVAEGARWQRLPLVLAAVVAGAVAAARLRAAPRGDGRRRRPAWRAVGVVAALGLVAAGAAAAWAFPVLRLPQPTGPAEVGTTVVEWTDPDRPEPATDDEGDRRTVVAQLWYPAAPGAASVDGAERMPYLGRDLQEASAVAAGIGAQFGVPAFLLDEAVRARGGAVVDAAPLDASFPVVLFSPGLAGVRTQATAWAEELASHGYVVVALDHPYDSAAVVLTDGTVVPSRVAASGDDAQDDRNAEAWAAVRAADLTFALDQLGRPGTLPDRLDGLPDTSRVALTGHSLGGASALLAATTDERVDAVVDVDGFPRGAPAPTQPVLALVAGAGTGSADGDRAYADALDRALAASAGPTYRLVVPRAGHLSLTDAALFLPPVPMLLGSIDRPDGPRTTAAATLAFLDATLRDGDDAVAVLDALGDLTTTGR
ncbi:alpha/beta hydrolase family protein [Actinotalea solisilvae]|uniref:alpha/beta hydrolase family protein n=1 Tax=Actinotalea solisilvae TaxID=2072922 RepID=UPI0018F190A0|nr:dienelactone hydrolase family protein [Actinotalea solisilvae]